MGFRFVNICLVLLSIAIFHTQSSLHRGRLRGPNICYNYDTGRHCCRKFIERNGFCILNRSATASSGTVRRQGGVNPSSKVRFAHRPHQPKVVSLTRVDEFGRPVGIAYSHGRDEEMSHQPKRESVEATDFYVPYDMETVRKRLAAQKNGGTVTTPPATHRLITNSPMLRFQSAPTVKPFRPWDNKVDRLTGKSKQIAVGRVGDGYVQAVLAPQIVVHQKVDDEADDTAAFKRRALVTRPLVGEKITQYTKAPTSPVPADDIQNRIYFKQVPIEDDNHQDIESVSKIKESTMPDSNVIVFKKCPESYTSVYSPEEGDLCYPTSALLKSEQNFDRAPQRGDAAVVCPSGHRLQSSTYGDACVPLDWQPCSGEPGCLHGQQPLVMPIAISSDCSQSIGEGLPCRNTGSIPIAEGCEGGTCEGSPCTDGGCGQPVIIGPQNCMGGDCGQPTSNCGDGGCGDCSDGGCNYPPTDNCNGGGCSEASSGCNDGSCGELVAAGSGRCLNGATMLSNGLCFCQEGFVGSQCEYPVFSETVPMEEDVDECYAAGTDGRGPCSYECMNTVGSFKCSCPAGSILGSDGVSCVLITCPKCMHGGYCDTDTSHCVCPAGFTGEICENDVDECAIGGTCSHECRNTFGSYACLCRQGHTLLRDGHSCEDWRCNPKCVNGGVCVKNKCNCPPGFKGIICQFNTRL